jgi:hypothetical protein
MENGNDELSIKEAGIDSTMRGFKMNSAAT